VGAVDWRRVAEIHSKTQAFRRRVDTAMQLLDYGDHMGPLIIASSWGKDSTALAGLAVECFGREACVLHLASPYALSGWEDVQGYFKTRCRVHVEPYRKSLGEYIAWLREVGLCFERSGSDSAARGKVSLASDWCMKNGFHSTALGLRAEESRRRSDLMRLKGRRYTKTDGMTMIHPLGSWRASDVWAFIHSRDLPHHPMYDFETHGYTRETIRNGGWLTTRDPGRISWLREHYPDQYRMLTDEFPRLRSFA